jgi:ADP-L-glycero-D-manno-heptose 6-epimerase
LKPLNLYGEVKHLFDLWALRNGYLEKIAGLKYFNAFGPNEYHKAKMRSVVLKAFEQIRAIKRVKLFKSYNSQYKDGRQLRDFVYVKDIVDMTLFIFNNPEANGIFNIGTGCARSFYDLTMSVFNAMKLRPNIEYIPMPEQIHNKYQYFTQAEMGKIKSLGYNKNTHSLEDAISDYVKNYLTQKNPYLKP